ncbi:putative ubiquitin-like-specific protease 1B [Triticum dicoccoides]|uniref:putative ubiquitin-like-specific protease 1B n=1 Tax=Triticum dicoccoides TaxID=85692 RepID=UPI00188F1472|nr:putative ubiquitin-like-specific protease 1B [Triticum dicoccoides]
MAYTWSIHSKAKKRANELCRSLIRHDMVPMPMNIDEDHWWLVVINLAKQECQILDSYDRTLEYYIEVTRPFRNGVHSILQSFSPSMQSRWSNLDVLSWRIVVVKEIPRQYDICSCGIFTIKFMKYWNGSELTSYFSQEHMETFRKKMPSEILLSSSNKISLVGKEVRDMLDV